MEERPQIGCVEDLATLTKLDEQILLEELQERYNRDLIYTYVGDILIAVNPFKDIGIYGKKETEKYKNAKKSSNPPHIFAVSDMAFQSISGYGGLLPKDQCILISGESGAGKTESTKLIIKQLIELSHGNSQIEQQILQVNPLLEAFGNAQTLMNDNSSRFGKYIQLRFLDGQVKGAKISEYLLEKSRVVGQHEKEENFHIFYYLFAGQRENTTTNLHLKDPNKFRYLTNGAEHFNSDLPHLAKEYRELLNSMDLVGFTDSEQETLFTMIAGILHLGNIKFETNEENDETLVSNPGDDLQTAASLLNIDADELQSCLTSMIAVAGGEYMKINYSKSKAADCRDALSKAIYGRLFGWIVNKINQLLAPEQLSYRQEYREIGILDIFGFEHFEKNSFEQACINLANEQLQFFFNQHIFKMEQEEYMKEGIDWTEIEFVDNKPLLDMFLIKPVGIISLLDEECQFPKATNKTFVEKLNQNFHKHPNFQKSHQSTSPLFTIHHYAGKVTYDTNQWLEKNRDTLPEGISDIMKSSKNKLIKTLFQVKVSQDAKRKATVGTKFKRSLHMLMEKMTRSSPIFVRCLKPNHNKRAGEFNNAYIQAQLLYTGMLETTKIRREGFAIRPPFSEFVER
ncbi:hypothetical protein LOTGIDRAFT_219481 [Lottia gigantea]|uniref:Myosin motor domain-containing protein n=1 Tax=Lottia gigantea TaxID=225164 RepID=V3ZZK6_LOTGI|nr:hypothetical protein LOTGIDRAFT_219481 [Lottia gigantea]ESO88100.1 hypothetical protein LOTGIDRAFT_219481 [Lottia gigantea]